MSQTLSLTTDSVIQAAEWLKSGRLLAYPTESVWGIGCDPFNEAAVQLLLAIKQRPIDKGMIVVTDCVERIEPLLNNLRPTQRQAVIDSWDMSSHTTAKQAHTWLLPLPQNSSHPLTVPIPSWITGAHDSVAVRVIAHPVIKQLCANLVSAHNPYGFIVSTSCNPSGQAPALSLAQAQAYFVENNDGAQVGYLQGETLGYQMPSQINDALTGQVLR
ncbi:L-threonylcarbamoyladenylate synthase [Psychrobacter urativorans]|uniref:Threonylcarbamoyl-AMP synthase n=1 Tax=Psychrobacter urativorans TaxID=45610 RepID=A0A0M4TEY9_9GAMM|nr:Sua5/YciO/YrdC/YwlC family protein [Psychrobacter urativorans]ALF59704.1 tRNA threonylcarbamoyladenosine biosynthesis protein RimN [Psychrobacter urativorans]